MLLVVGFGLLSFMQLLGVLPFCRLWKGWLYWQFSSTHRYGHQKFIFVLGRRISRICVWCREARLNILQGMWNKNSRWWWGKPSSFEHDNGPSCPIQGSVLLDHWHDLLWIKPFICWVFFFLTKICGYGYWYLWPKHAWLGDWINLCLSHVQLKVTNQMSNGCLI